MYLLARDYFTAFLDQTGGTLDRVTPNMLQDYVTWLSRKRLGASSIRQYTIGARRYMKWLRSLGYDATDSQPALPQAKHHVPGILEPEELAAFLREVQEKVPDPYRTAISMLPFTGLRVGEVCTLRKENVVARPSAGFAYLHISGKSKHDRDVPIMPAGLPVLVDYLTTKRREFPSNDWIFSSSLGNSLSTRVVEQHTADARRRLGIRHLTPHTLRHTYATELKRSGFSDIELARILGHANVNTTQIYVHTNVDDLFAGLARVRNPLGTPPVRR